VTSGHAVQSVLSIDIASYRMLARPSDPIMGSPIPDAAPAEAEFVDLGPIPLFEDANRVRTATRLTHPAHRMSPVIDQGVTLDSRESRPPGRMMKEAG
jgi:hypothetical protein